MSQVGGDMGGESKVSVDCSGLMAVSGEICVMRGYCDGWSVCRLFGFISRLSDREVICELSRVFAIGVISSSELSSLRSGLGSRCISANPVLILFLSLANESFLRPYLSDLIGASGCLMSGYSLREGRMTG